MKSEPQLLLQRENSTDEKRDVKTVIMIIFLGSSNKALGSAPVMLDPL